jgi:hypothetical protein
MTLREATIGNSPLSGNLLDELKEMKSPKIWRIRERKEVSHDVFSYP